MEVLQILRNHIAHDPTSALSDVEEFSSILSHAEEQLRADLLCGNNELHLNQHIARCIDLEGLDGCGKSTVALELNLQLTAQGQQSILLGTPPKQLLRFRPYFDAQPESIRRAFYNLGNLIVSSELKNEQNAIVILDRYWPSTIAYQLAKLSDDSALNISWPNYLVQPALIVYIHVDEVERRRRIAQRSVSVPVTLEEKQLAEQEAFRRRLDLIYRHHIPSSHLHVVDGNRPTSIIATEILALLQQIKP